MTKSSLWKVCCIVLFPCLAVSAKDPEPQPPPSPVVGGIDGEDAAESDSTDLPRTYVEDSSPATFGATVITVDGDRLNVLNVLDGSPAHLAGLVAGDEIISINGQLLTETEQFNSYLASHPADPLRIVVMRDGAEQTLIVNGVPNATESSDVRPALGIRFLQANHVILQEVVPGSPAEHAGLQLGDHVVAVNGTPVASSDHLINLVTAASINSDLELVILRGGDRQTISVTPAAWEKVFDGGRPYTTLKPVISDSTVTVPGASFVGPVYYGARVSPVGVPAIAYPTYYGYPYGDTAWSYPYYPYFGGVYYYPNWYIYGRPVYYGYGPVPGDPGTRTQPANSDSASLDVNSERQVVRTLRDHEEIE